MTKNYLFISAVIFAVVAALHLIRIITDTAVVFGNWSVPMWLSWAGFFVAGALSFVGLSLLRKGQ